MNQIMITRLIIETTRQCQLMCNHCLRGDAEKLTMSRGHMEQLLENVEFIDNVTFTGGEPFLNPECIEDFISICRLGSIEVNSFFIATNGIVHETDTDLSRRGLAAVCGLYALCADNEMTQIRISNTPWHGENTSQENLLSAFSFTHWEGADWIPASIIAEGRGAGIHGSSRTVDNDINWDYPDEVDVYLNCEGKVCWNCDLSYETQRLCGLHLDGAVCMLDQINDARMEECA